MAPPQLGIEQIEGTCSSPLGLRGAERRSKGWDFDLPNPSIREWNRRGCGASPNLVGSHILYLHLHSGLLARHCPWFFPTRGFHVNPYVYLWFSIYLTMLVDWLLSCLLLVLFCSSSCCMVEISIWCTHKFFDMLMMEIDVLVSLSLQVYPTWEVWAIPCLKELILWVVLKYAHKVFSQMLVSG